MTTADRQLPHSPDIERNVIGAVLIDVTPGIAEAVQRLRPEHFFVQAHRYIWQRLKQQIEQGQSDLAILTEDLRQHGELDKIPGGAAYVSTLIDGIPRINPQLSRWVEVLEQKLILRRYAHTAHSIEEMALGANGNALEVLQDIANLSATFKEEVGQKRILLSTLTVSELVNRDVPPREMILSPFLPTQGLVMLYSKRGVGKTYISLGIALAVASGGAFLRWRAGRPRRVLYVDGEMPLITIKDRVRAIVSGSEFDLPEENLRIITPDEQGIQIPDLASAVGQQAVEQHLEGVELLILDNLSALVRDGVENEGESWLPVQGWALELRRRGISVLFDHHAGKGGTQRGTSRREDLLDSVLVLKHPADYSAENGLRCEVYYEKSRGFYGDDAKAFEVCLQTGERGEAIWTHRDMDVCERDLVLRLKSEGLRIREIAEETGLSKSKVGRIVRDFVPCPKP